MTQREEFLSIFRQHVTRPGADRLLDWLDNKTDFFTCPASTRFHGACEGGLCMHSLNVYHALHDSFFQEGDSEESFAICALLHDLCKANYYKVSTRNVKNEATGQWQYLNSYADSVVTTDTAGRYLLTNDTLTFIHMNIYALAAAGVVLVAIVVVYIAVKKRYWFW